MLNLSAFATSAAIHKKSHVGIKLQRSWKPLCNTHSNTEYLPGCWFLLSRGILGGSLNISWLALCHMTTAEMKWKWVHWPKSTSLHRLGWSCLKINLTGTIYIGGWLMNPNIASFWKIQMQKKEQLEEVERQDSRKGQRKTCSERRAKLPSFWSWKQEWEQCACLWGGHELTGQHNYCWMLNDGGTDTCSHRRTAKRSPLLPVLPNFLNLLQTSLIWDTSVPSNMKQIVVDVVVCCKV